MGRLGPHLEPPGHAASGTYPIMMIACVHAYAAGRSFSGGRHPTFRTPESERTKPRFYGFFRLGGIGLGEELQGSERGRVAPGDCSPRAPTDPYVHFRAYGSSCHVLATRRHTEWIAIGGGSG